MTGAVSDMQKTVQLELAAKARQIQKSEFVVQNFPFFFVSFFAKPATNGRKGVAQATLNKKLKGMKWYRLFAFSRRAQKQAKSCSLIFWK
jgi:hypothetical protein